MTLVEVMVAIVILLVGVLGTVAMIDTSNAATSKTKAREGGTNVARSVVEVARGVPYRTLTAQSLLDELAKRPSLADSGGGSDYTISSRGFDYDATVTVCSIDDPKDNLGSHDNTVSFCPDSDGGSAGGGPQDRNPDDYKRVTVQLEWRTAGVTSRVKQTSIVMNPVGGLGPSVTDLTMTQPSSSGTPVQIKAGSTARFSAKTSTAAAGVNWSVDGDMQGSASGNLVDWTFEWQLDNPDGTPRFYDNTYVVQATGVDDKGRSGAPKALTIVVNRRKPFAPASFEGGRNGNGNRVDLQWHASLEGDVLGYRVYRSGSSTSLGSRVTCFGQASANYHGETSCLDESAPAPGSPVYYRVVAVDKDPDTGALREGDWSPPLLMVEDNRPPTEPTELVACTGGQPDCNGPDGQPAPEGTTVISWKPSTDPDTGDSVYFYRIYRDGSGYDSRHDIFYPAEGAGLAYVDSDSTNAAQHEYRVTAVDRRFGESPLSGAVTR